MFSLPAIASKTPGFGFKASLGLGKPRTPGQCSYSWPHLCSLFLSPLNTAALSRPGVPSLKDLITNTLRWSCCNNSRHKVHNICTPDPMTWLHDLIPWPSSLSSALPGSLEKLSSTKPVLGARKVGACWSKVTGAIHCAVMGSPRGPQGGWACLFVAAAESMLVRTHHLSCCYREESVLLCLILYKKTAEAWMGNASWWDLFPIFV